MNKILKNKKIIANILIIVSIILLAVISLQAGFATTTIDNTTSGGISGALSSSSDGDTIELDEGTYTGNNNTNITIDKNITIQGKTKDKVILDAQGLSRIFTINDRLNVTFINITFINGYTIDDGGAIYNNYYFTTMTLINCTFTQNNANASGGAIWSSGINFNVVDCTFTQNNANASAGAIYSQGSDSSIINCNFINNTANISGGAIRLHDSNIIVANCTFYNNTANGNNSINDGGGAIFGLSTNSNVVNCTFTQNNANAYGGAIWSSGFNILDCNFTQNNANQSAGAIWYRGDGSTIINCNFINNTGNSSGGAIGLYYNENSSIINCTFYNNIANTGGSGGAIFSISANSRVVNCTFYENSANASGGAIWNSGTNFTVLNSDFDHNTAKNGAGGAIVNNGGNNFTIGDCTFNNNFLYNNTRTGGALYNYGLNCTIYNSKFNNNTAYMGGSAITTIGSIYITNSTFANNTGNNTIFNAGNVTMDNNIIVMNNGDGILNRGNATIINNNITSNAGNAVVNNGTLTGSGNIIDYRTNVSIINTIVSANRVTISVKAVDDQGIIIVGATIDFYVNGVLVGSAITNNEGIAQFNYTANAGLQNIIVSMPEFNNTNSLASVAAIHLTANNSTSVKVVLEKNTVITVSAPTINEGKKTNIKVTLKDINGNILKNKKVLLKINGKTYTATTNNKGIAVFKITGLKGGKYNLTVKFAGDSNYKSSTTKAVQKVNAKSNLGIVSIKELSTSKRLSTCKVTIANKGSLKSKSTTLALFHMRKGIKIKTKYIKIKSIAPGKKISIIVSYFPDRANHRYCIAHFQVDPKNKNKEVILANNKKSISLKH